MGGELTAEANLGAGLTVHFALTAPIGSLAQDSPADEPTIDARSAHILIVDDNATNRMVAEALCEMFDCTSEQVVDGVEAVEMARERPLRPDPDGHQDAAHGRRDRRPRHPRAAWPGRPIAPIVALTANADPADVQSYIAAGMQDVVEKPIKPERLAIVLSALLSGGEDSEEAAA
jgi:CheY-like chemotaxis protein